MPSNQFSSYSHTEKWMKLADKKTNTVAETYTHSQSYSATYKNGVAQNIKAKESYGYDIQGPSGRVKEKKSAGFDESRAANGKTEGEAWRYRIDGFSDETFNNGFNVITGLRVPLRTATGSVLGVSRVTALGLLALRPALLILAVLPGRLIMDLAPVLVPGLSNGLGLS
ncbi:hypothetical protein BJX65DRAFT_314191 [Aspergillus insuetus]